MAASPTAAGTIASALRRRRVLFSRWSCIAAHASGRPVRPRPARADTRQVIQRELGELGDLPAQQHAHVLAPGAERLDGAHRRRAQTARAENRRFRPLSALRYKMDLHRRALRALNRPKVARTVRMRCAPQPCCTASVSPPMQSPSSSARGRGRRPSPPAS